MTQIENLERWVVALRSGKYKQGHYMLRDVNNKFCCLGVACDILHPEAWSATAVDMIGDARLRFYLSDVVNDVVIRAGSYLNEFCSYSFIPIHMLKELGITDEMQRDLTVMNDDGYDGSKSFSEIADYIEQTIIPIVKNQPTL